MVSGELFCSIKQEAGHHLENVWCSASKVCLKKYFYKLWRTSCKKSFSNTRWQLQNRKMQHAVINIIKLYFRKIWISLS